MSRRIAIWFNRFSRSIKPPPKGVRKQLLPHRPCGPTYQVEVTSRTNIRYQLQSIYRLLPLRLLNPAMALNEEETVAAFSPPEAVRGMKTLDRSLFSCTISLPGLKVPSKHISALTKTLKKSLFKMPRVKAVADLSADDTLRNSHKLFLLDPQKIQTVEDFSVEQKQTLADCSVDVEELPFYDLEVGYQNWSTAEIFRSVLPETSDGLSSYSIIGHIAHLNLKPEVLDFKHLIGEVIIDKNPSVRTVVNKVNIIDNTFRNFQMELLAGEDNLVTRAKENGCVFEMDFSKVYWNPRLSTEHQRVVDQLKRGDMLYDVFAGVGPFAIPAAKKGVQVLANDLNPHSFSALASNVTLNKVKPSVIQAHNMDGRQFILTVLKPDLTTRLKARSEQGGGNGCEGSESTPPSETKAGARTVSVDSFETSSEQSTIKKSAENEAAGDANGTVSAESGSTEQRKSPESRKNLHSVSSKSMDVGKFQKMYITMNLPALAVEFLDAFCGLLSEFPVELRSNPCILDAMPTVLCYCFENKEVDDAKSRAEKVMGLSLPVDTRVRHVRNVAPSKEMMCLEFPLTAEILFGEKSQPSEVQMEEGVHSEEQPAAKRPRMSESV